MFKNPFRKKPPIETPPEPEPNHYGKRWLEALEARFGPVTTIRRIQAPHRPIIYVHYFDELPEKGMMTAVTCGLAEARHPDWKFGAPELMVTMESQSHSWGEAAGFLVSSYFGEKRFAFGDVFELGGPISEEGEMNTYLVFGPPFLDPEQATFVLSDRTVVLFGLYPMYDDEIETYGRVGLETFWHAEGFEMHNPTRGRVRVP